RDAKVSGDDVVFALMHHPLSSLEDWDSSESGIPLFSGAVKAVLHGHLHASAAWEKLRTALVFAAGSSYADSLYKNSYNLGQLDFDRGKGTLSMRRWIEARRVWEEDQEVGGQPPGQIKFDMPRTGPQPKPRPHNTHHPNPPRFTLGIDVGSSKIAARLLELRDDRPPIVREEAIERPIQRPAESYL